jgi:hypothetical protein
MASRTEFLTVPRENPGELIHIDIKKLGRIGSVGHRITGRQTGVVNRHLGIGWSSSMSASTMRPASPLAV